MKTDTIFGLSILLTLASGCGDSTDTSIGGAGAGAASSTSTSVDCSQFQPTGTGSGGMPMMDTCLQDNCADPCQELLAFNPGMLPTGAGGGPSVPPGEGSDLWVAQSCNSCHGDNGAGRDGPNITSSQSAGIGSWTADEISAAIRDGVSKNGESLCNNMPRLTEAQLSQEDLGILIGYVQSLPPIDIANRGMLCGGSTSTGMMGFPEIPSECLSCADANCPEIAAILRCFSEGQAP